MPRLDGGSRSLDQSHLLTVDGSSPRRVDMLPQRSPSGLATRHCSNGSISASHLSLSPPKVKNTQRSSSASFPSLRPRQGFDSSRILPEGAPEGLPRQTTLDNSKLSSGGSKRKPYRAAEDGRTHILPTSKSDDDCPNVNSEKRRNFLQVRAAETGQADVLPTYSLSRSPQRTVRARTKSVSDLSVNAEKFNTLHQSLRSRRRSIIKPQERAYSCDDMSDDSFSNNNRSRGRRRSMKRGSWQDRPGEEFHNYHSSDDSGFNFHSPPTYRHTNEQQKRFSARSYSSYCPKDSVKFLKKTLMQFKLQNILQAIAVLSVFYLVFDSYTKALDTTAQLLEFKRDESMLMLHLQRVEQHSINLHEHLTGLNEQVMSNPTDTAARASYNSANSKSKAASSSVQVDLELIRKQTQQLREMEQELNHEVKGLQGNIQRTSRNSIIRTYGEGPVQINLEVELPSKDKQRSPEHHEIGILLWYDTPHAAWTLLEQVRKGIWDGAPLKLDDKGVALAAQPPSDIVSDGSMSKLEFVESSRKSHEPWTVGLSDFSNGHIGMFINLADNSELHKNYVCIGKIFDGFDVLQQLVDLSRKQQNQQASDDHVYLVIRKATGSHLTRRDIAGIM